MDACSEVQILQSLDEDGIFVKIIVQYRHERLCKNKSIKIDDTRCELPSARVHC